jgi:restriction endonuclease Mrr
VANHVHHFDLWWNPAVAKQAEGRAWRRGQQKQVFVKSLLTNDTIEERIYALLAKKQHLFDAIVDSLSDSDLEKGLTIEDLLSLFDLTKEQPSNTNQSANKVGRPNSLSSLSAREFEHLVADLYTKLGYRTQLTPQGRDQGVDVFARQTTEAGVQVVAIQCKHYPNRVVGVEVARELNGNISERRNLHRGVIVTTGTFSRDCQGFAEGCRIDLIDGARLKGMLTKYKV